jgi:streptomycin 6-kinase
MLDVPDRLVKAIIFARGPADGRAWLRALPGRVEIYRRRWDLQPLEVAQGGAMSCCLFVTTSSGQDAVLKIPFDAASGRLERRSLQRWARASASPQVLAAAPSSGVFLMARVRPGDTATPTGRAADSEHFCDLIARMTRPELGGLRGLRTIEAVTRMRFEWAYERFLEPGYQQETAQMPGVEQLLDTLVASGGPGQASSGWNSQVIHGDLQCKNILVGPAGSWQAIDPFTCRGDLNAEAALWAVVQQDDSTIEERIAQLADCAQLDERRLRAWCFVYAVTEYRSYAEATARRTRSFSTDLDWRELAKDLG